MLSRIFIRRRAKFVMTPVGPKEQRKARRLTYRPQLESLEDRMLLATDTWTGAGGTANWSNAANWNRGVAPAGGDDLVFPLTGYSTINDLPPGMAIGSITFAYEGQPAFVTLSGNAIFLDGSIINNSPIPPPPPVAAATSFPGIGVLDFNAITMGANADVIGNLTIDSPFDMNGFSLGVSSQPGFVTFQGPVSLNGTISGFGFINGPVTLTGPGNIISSDASIGLEFTTIDLNGFGLTLSGSADQKPVTISGSGSVTMNKPPFAFGIWLITANWSGLTTVNGSQFQVSGTIIGPVTVNAGGQLHGNVNINGPVNIYGGSMFDISSIAGAVTVDGGTLRAYGIAGPVTINSGTVGSPLSGSSQVSVTGGELDTSGTIFGPTDIMGGTLDVSSFRGPLVTGSLTFDSGSTFEADLGATGTNAETGYALVQVNGSADLGGATISLPYTPGPSMVILQTTDTITGTFNRMPDSQMIIIGGTTFQIHYYNPSPGFPGRVVLSSIDDPGATATAVTSSQGKTPALFPPTLTASVGEIAMPPVNGTTPPASGTVTFMEGSTPLSVPIPLVNGLASFTPLLTAGTHIITAVFSSSDANFSNSTSAGFAQIITPIDMDWQDVMTGDFNGDGKQDIVGRTAAGQWWMALSTGSSFGISQLWSTWSTGTTWLDVQTGDFNGDGKTDIVGRASVNGQWWVALSNGSGFTNALWDRWSTGVTWADVRVGDFNGDGKADIAGRYLEGGTWWVGLTTGSGFSTTKWDTWSTGATWVNVNVGDFNGDGKTDIVGSALQNGRWYVGLSNGSTGFNTTLWATWSTAATWVDVQVGNFNGDGKTDLTGRWLEGGQWWTAISNGSTGFNTSLWETWSTAATWVGVRVGDFNGDGKADVTGRYLEGGSWWTAISNGTSFTTTQWETWSTVPTWVDVQAGDFTGSGKASITGRYEESGTWWTGVSSGSDFSTSLWTTWPA